MIFILLYALLENANKKDKALLQITNDDEA